MRGTKLDERQEVLLRKRLDIVLARLDGGEEGDHRKAEALMGMFAGYPSTKADSGTAAAYLFAVRMYPHWAVSDACDMILQGKVGFLDTHFCPSASDVAKVCATLTKKLVRERESLQQILACVV